MNWSDKARMGYPRLNLFIYIIKFELFGENQNI
jgi:hypothetical protein